MSAPSGPEPAPRPAGFAAVTPYIFVEDAPAFLAFLTHAFDAAIVGQHKDEDGRIANAQIQMGDALIMVSEAGRGYPAMPASYYFYVHDADTVCAQAVKAGGTKIMDVADMPYGDRQGGIRDPHGNLWWVSQRLVAGGYFD